MNRAPYDKIADEFAKLRVNLFPKEKKYLDLLLETASAGGSVLDLGCGTGKPIAKYIESLGYKIVGVDASVKLLEMARLEMPTQQWIHSSIEDFNSDKQFAAVVCWDSMFHLPREMHKGIFKNIHSLLNASGRLMVSSGGDVGKEGFTDKMFGEEFYYDSLTAEELFATLEECGFKVVATELFDLPDGDRDKGKRGTIAEKT